MPLATLESVFLASQALIAFDGATLSAPGSVIKPAGDATSYTTVGRTALPAVADTAWINLGIVKKSDFDPGHTKEEIIKAGSPGRLQVRKRIQVGAEPKWTFTLQELNYAGIAVLFQSLLLNGSSTQANPMEAAGTRLAWVKLQLYRQDDTLHSAQDIYGAIKAHATTFDPAALTELTLELGCIFSPLQSIGF